MAYERINFQNYPSTATPLDANNLNKMDAELKYLDDNIALMLPSGTVAVPYNATTQYHEGNLVLNDQKLWKAKIDSRGVTPVEGSEWTETSISAELSNVSTGRDLSLEAFMAGVESGEITDHDNKDYYIEDADLAAPNAYNIDYGESTVGATLDAHSDEIANLNNDLSELKEVTNITNKITWNANVTSKSAIIRGKTVDINFRTKNTTLALDTVLFTIPSEYIPAILSAQVIIGDDTMYFPITSYNANADPGQIGVKNDGAFKVIGHSIAPYSGGNIMYTI